MTNDTKMKIALVVKGYPRLSETFIAQEILELERAGFDIEIISLRRPTDKHLHPVHGEISADKHYLPEYLYQEPIRVTIAKLNCLFKRGFYRACWAFFKDLLRDPTSNRVRRFGQAMVLSHEHTSNCDMIYVHFLHTPGSVARYASMITGKPFAVSAHAIDIWTLPKWEIREKLAACEWLVTCTKGGADYLRTLSPAGKVHLVYHGLDLERFPPHSGADSKNDGSTPEKAVEIITVGRAVEKKGLAGLLDAFAELPESLFWKWTHIGGGPLRAELIAKSEVLGLSERCAFLGALPQSEVLKAYKKSNLFVLPSRIDENGDRDGLPNVIVEAQSQKLAVVSTNISGIPELIENSVNGLLVDPDNVGALKEAILELAANPERRNKMGVNGEEKVRSKFNNRETIGSLVTLLSNTIRGSR